MKENRNTEFKSDISNSFLKTVSAYANYDGGIIIFGVNDQGDAVGIDHPEKRCLDIEDMINDSIRPQPDYTLSVTDSGKTVTLKVSPGYSKPYLYRSKAYKRNDTATIEVDNTELRRLLLEGERLDFERLPSRDQDLQFSVLADELKAKTGIDHFNMDVLKTLNLYSDHSGYNNAAAILADNNSFPGIDISRYGDSMDIFLKRLTLDGRSILSSYHEAVEMYRDYYQYEIIDGIDRKKVETIPENAYREALANAVVHRTWDINSNIRISMFNDHVEIVSAGGLPTGISTEVFLEGRISVLRNPILANVFHRLNLIEKFGTGIRRIKEAYADSFSKPSFLVTADLIQIDLPLLDLNPGMSEDESIIYKALSKRIAKPISAIENDLRNSFSRSKSLSLLKRLADKGFVVIEGSGRGTKYRALK